MVSAIFRWAQKASVAAASRCERLSSRCSPSGGGAAGLDGASVAALLDPGALTDDAGIEAAAGGGGQHAQHRAPGLDQRDADHIFIDPGGEFLGAIQRVHQPEAGRDLGDMAIRKGLLRHDGQIGRGEAQALGDDALGEAIGGGDGTRIALALDGEAGAAHALDGGAGIPGQAAGEVEEFLLVHDAGLSPSGGMTQCEARPIL